ncbi:protein MIGRI [Chitinimonas koreensis]|uniref:protein MIGRI n=1 Tax=Chitinimonas koreensis TaxID=356302 RepID=UPI0004253001|nr:hypothetical protein [Chitinimonas koreensis]QNM96535.1 hypothetical protein H9L41_22685 [Chitinimonas koreensis]
MLPKLIRLALFAALVLLVWNAVLKPETRRRIRGHVEVLALALLGSSLLMAGWHWWQHGFAG